MCATVQGSVPKHESPLLVINEEFLNRGVTWNAGVVVEQENGYIYTKYFTKVLYKVPHSPIHAQDTRHVDRWRRGSNHPPSRRTRSTSWATAAPRGQYREIFVCVYLIVSNFYMISLQSSHSHFQLCLGLQGAKMVTQSRNKDEETLHLWIMNSFKLSIQWNVVFGFTCRYSFPTYSTPPHEEGGK